MDELDPARRELLIGGVMAAIAAGMAGGAQASPLDSAQTIIIPKGEIPWKPHPIYGGHVQETCTLFGDPNKAGLYLSMIRWHIGFMSIPHYYDTDRICMVMSGTWWCNSGADFDPKACVPVPAGGFVRRVARTHHYDGVISGGTEPVEVAVFGMGPINYKPSDPTRAQGYMRA